MCLLIDNGRVLVADGKSIKGAAGRRPIIPGTFYRVLGGSIDFGERAVDAVRREIREEVSSEIQDLELLEVVENMFEYAGEPGHDIVFLFKGTLANTELSKKDSIHVNETDYEFDAIWVLFSFLLKGDVPLYPALDWSRFLA